MKSFDVPQQFRSSFISAIKNKRKQEDKLKKDFTPTTLEFGTLSISLARHFGFCYGVENAIEIAFKAVDENTNKRIYLLSEMIHNPGVNADLIQAGVEFIMDTKGKQLIPWEQIHADDIVIIPAFGTTVEIEQLLKEKGIEPTRYETTCPFVEKVWNRAEKIGLEGYTIVVHGKPQHEETRATFSHSKEHAPTLVVNDMNEAITLAAYIKEEIDSATFYEQFKGQYNATFDPKRDLKRIGVVNQTTMLASDTQAIAEYLKQVMKAHYQLDDQSIANHFADTRDTLCYATNDNQSAVQAMLETKADAAIIIGGYNSSNTSHLVELCETKIPTYYIKDELCLLDNFEIEHFNFHTKELLHGTLAPTAKNILISAGASCPDAVVERVIERLCHLHQEKQSWEALKSNWI
jgi:4-hydroxy-3-methylbut-2-en-1-yl diphosphate reductase